MYFKDMVHKVTINLSFASHRSPMYLPVSQIMQGRVQMITALKTGSESTHFWATLYHACDHTQPKGRFNLTS